MNARSPFDRRDLDELDARFLSRASAVVSMREIHAGNHDTKAIGLRHDCDAGHSLATAVKMARWERERGYRSTYYVLHTSRYWHYPEFRESLERIALHGHEIGIHTNALAETMRGKGDPHEILHEAIGLLRSWGHEVTGVAGHGDPFCNREAASGEPWFANDEQFTECARPGYGPADRVITRGKVSYRLDPRPLADFGLDYEAVRVSAMAGHFAWRVSDSGGRWKHSDDEPTVEQAAEMFGCYLADKIHPGQQLQLLVHPDWWADAFVPAAVAA